MVKGVLHRMSLCMYVCMYVSVCAHVFVCGGEDGSSLEFVDTMEYVCVCVYDRVTREVMFLVSGGHSLISRASYETLRCVAQWRW